MRAQLIRVRWFPACVQRILLMLGFCRKCYSLADRRRLASRRICRIRATNEELVLTYTGIEWRYGLEIGGRGTPGICTHQSITMFRELKGHHRIYGYHFSIAVPSVVVSRDFSASRVRLLFFLVFLLHSFLDLQARAKLFLQIRV